MNLGNNHRVNLYLSWDIYGELHFVIGRTLFFEIPSGSTSTIHQHGFTRNHGTFPIDVLSEAANLELFGSLLANFCLALLLYGSFTGNSI